MVSQSMYHIFFDFLSQHSDFKVITIDILDVLSFLIIYNFAWIY